MFTRTKDGSRPLNTPPRSFVSSLPRSVTLTRKHDSLFSITYTLFSTHNSAHLFYFLETAHSLRKTWGGVSAETSKYCDLCKPNRIYLLQKLLLLPQLPLKESRHDLVRLLRFGQRR